jgi:hydroxymethylbilane synthase
VGAIAEVVESIDEEGNVFDELSLRGCVAALDGSDVIRASGIGDSGRARELGLSVAAELFELGARELMRGARHETARGSDQE